MVVDIAHQETPADPNHWVSLIYQCAKNKDVEGIKNLLAQGVCIDERYQSSPFSAAAKLASEKDIKSVEFLLRFGADVNVTAFGIAFAKDFYYSENFRAQYECDPLSLARGAAAADDRPYAEWLRISFRLKKAQIIFWAAWGGNFMYVEDLRFNDIITDTNMAAAGAAFAGEREYADTLELEGDQSTIHMIAGYAAQGGHVGHAEFMRRHREANLHFIARHAASGGQRDFAEFYRTEHKANEIEIASGAAYSGHRQHSEFLRTRNKSKKKTTAIAAQAAAGGHFAYMEDLYLNHGADLNKIAHKLVGKIYFKNPTSALRIFSFINNDKLRNKLAAKLATFSKKNKNVCENIVGIAQRAGQVRALQQKYNFTYDQAMTWMQDKALRTFCLYYYAVTKSSPNRVPMPWDVFTLIMKFAFPDYATEDLQKYSSARKVLSDANKKQLQINLTQYSHGLFKTNVKTLLKKVKAAGSCDEVNRLLTTELENEKNPELQVILKRYHRN